MAFKSSVDARAGAAAALLVWYDRHRRDLPWRALPGAPADPYTVWLSEIMLQQTTVTAVKPYFLGFLARWPNVGLLAEASGDEVMRAWAGLGYYSRARNLHACAKIVAGPRKGIFPDTEAGLQDLPGIGPYTAAAVAAIAFGRPAAAVDGNAERVLARLFSISAPLPAARSEIKAKAAAMVPVQRPGDFAQAMMDLGAMICSPKHPSCDICPLLKFCRGHALGCPESLPHKAPRRERPLRQGAAFFVRRRDGAVLVRTRPPKGLLGGMTELLGTDWQTDFDAASAASQAPIEAIYWKLDREVTHAFTHFALRLDIYVAEVPNGWRAPTGYRFVPDCGLDKEAFPSVMRKVIEAVRQSRAQTSSGETDPGSQPETSARQSDSVTGNRLIHAKAARPGTEDYAVRYSMPSAKLPDRRDFTADSCDGSVNPPPADTVEKLDGSTMRIPPVAFLMD